MITEQARRNYEARIAELETSLDKLTRTLRIAGFADAGGDLWKPPLGPAAPPLLARIDALEAERDQLIQAVADHVTVRAEQHADLHAALRLVSDLRFAVGDDGKRMHDELIAHLSELRKDAERYRFVRNHGATISDDDGFWHYDEVLDDKVDRLMETPQ